MPTHKNNRSSDYDIDPLFLRRWSPRAMSGEILEEKKLMTLFEAARWAPSSRNLQPWRFIYAVRNDTRFTDFISLLAESNQTWCKNAAVLVVAISDTQDKDGNFSRTHSLDTGSAWENLALQGAKMDLVVHGMGGFDFDKAKQILNLTDRYAVEMMIAIGKPGNKEDLPEKLQEREVPSGRKELNDIVFRDNLSSQIL